LRSGSVPKIVSAPALHFSRPPPADRSRFQNQFFAVVTVEQLLNQPFTVTAYAAEQASHPQRDETGGNYMAAAEMSMILRVGSNRTRRFRSSIDISAAAKARL
jgi:hypothetical protein